MKIAPKPNKELLRLRSLSNYDILDTPREEEFDIITDLASVVTNSSISLISLIDQNRQWFKAHTGLSINETGRDEAFCSHAILEPQNVMVVHDARTDSRFSDNPLVTGFPNVIFYTGIPLINEEGFALGTLCVIDHEPKELSVGQIEALKVLAKQAMKLMELRKNKVKGIKTSENSISLLSELILQNFGDKLDEEIKGYLEKISKCADNYEAIREKLKSQAVIH